MAKPNTDTTQTQDSADRSTAQDTSTKPDVSSEELVTFWKSQAEELKSKYSDLETQFNELKSQAESKQTKSQADQVKFLTDELEKTKNSLKQMVEREKTNKKLSAVSEYAKTVGLKEHYLKPDVLSSLVDLDTIDPDNQVTVKLAVSQTRERFPDIFGGAANMPVPNSITTDYSDSYATLQRKVNEARERAIRTQNQTDAEEFARLSAQLKSLRQSA